MPTRRHALKTAAALTALGLSACRKQEFVSLVGGFTYESQSRGHLLRGPQVWPAPSQTIRTGCIIAGGGVAGLAASRGLRLRGQDDFALLELADAAGGNARGGVLRGIAHPLGAHYLPAPSENAPQVAALLEELGVRRRVAGRWEYDERVLCHSPQERLHFRGAWQDGLLPLVGVGATTLAQYQRFHALIERWQQTKAFSIPSKPSKLSTQPAARALHGTTFAAYLAEQGLNDAHLLWYLDYCCRDDYGAGTATVSAWAGVHYFAARHGFGLPASLSSFEAEKSAVLTWPQGNGFLTQALAAPLGDRLRCQRVVLRISPHRSGVVVDAWNAANHTLERYEAPRCIVALPAFVAARVIENAPTPLQHRAAAVQYAAWSVANIYLNAPLDSGVGSAPDIAWDNVAYGSPSLGYVHATHQSTSLWPAPTVLTHYTAWGTGAAARQALLSCDWTSLQGAVAREISTLHPDASQKMLEINITRYGHAMAAPVPQTDFLAQPELPRIRFAHSDWAGYSVFEEAFEQGIQAV